MRAPDRVSQLLVALVIIATAAFAIGAAIEKSEHQSETTSAPSVAGSNEGAPAAENGGESAAQHAAEGGASESAAVHASEANSEKLLGLDPEATALVVVAVISSLALAAAVWFRPDHILLLALLAAAMFVFAALDIREAIHQSDESNGGLMILASLIAALHLAAACLAVYLARLRSRPRIA